MELICTCEFFKKRNCTSRLNCTRRSGSCNFSFLKNSLVQINSKLISKPYDYQNNFRTQAKTCGHVLANTVRYQGQIGSRKPNIVKLSQSWPKHALKVTPGPLGALPGPIWPQNLTVFAKTCPQLTLRQSRWPGVF